MSRYFLRVFSLIFIALFCSLTSAADAPKPDSEGFVPLFNGKDLAGWEGDKNIWKVENGCIVGQTEAEGPKKIDYNTFLILKDKKFKNFVLKFDYRLTKGGNSGMQVRSWVMDGDKPYRVAGYQADFDGDNNYTGIVYGENYRGILAHRGQVSIIGDNHQPKEVVRYASNEELKEKIKVEEWNEYEITADGFVIVNKINGSMMSVLVDEDTKERRDEGILAIQAHVGPPMKVEVKNIRIKVIE
ncbi:MAG: 3-keto-disaccharide hydrolase [Thermoguttaceae bacterium]